MTGSRASKQVGRDCDVSKRIGDDAEEASKAKAYSTKAGGSAMGVKLRWRVDWFAAAEGPVK